MVFPNVSPVSVAGIFRGQQTGETLGKNTFGTRPRSPKNPQQPLDPGRENLREYIERLYGEETVRQTQRLETLRSKRVHLLCSLTFLLRCRDTKTIPAFLRTKRTILSPQASRIYDRLEHALLRERIHTTRKKLDSTDKELLGLHITISQKMRSQDWDKIDTLSYKKMEKEMMNHTARQKQKFNKCQTSQQKPTLDTMRIIINLSGCQL